jgi:hypothetical protein
MGAPSLVLETWDPPRKGQSRSESISEPLLFIPRPKELQFHSHQLRKAEEENCRSLGFASQ